jgi:type IV secretory pathway VirB2 component (pilin)
MNEVEIYVTIRNEIVTNHVLMHVTTLVVVALLLGGAWLCEKRGTVLSVFLPLLSLSWAAAMVRFDFFIQRQGAYLRAVEARLRESGTTIPLWESWKTSLSSTAIVVPLADLIAIMAVVVPTIYLLFGPSQAVFADRQWRWGKLYAWGVTVIIVLLLGCLPFIPKIAQR